MRQFGVAHEISNPFHEILEPPGPEKLQMFFKICLKWFKYNSI